MKEVIQNKLNEALSPTHLEIIDESHRHKGHLEWRPEGETHFKLVVVADAFTDISRVNRQKLVYQALDSQLKTKIHALSVKCLTPKEFS